ncbi:dihydropyrimidine dehydrogenase [Halorhabdus sp. CBA1104]|uniref:tRNA-dihydrouridine synthase n=1 Tax=Halorhabdus sp. CBA1104 TaxID=1380432 RepID=UPI0012B3AA74|nr:tRNA-dihydrouridine synthase [Halorhabdus sp. CBA1104]QGN06582.1 dihydropyrimidine dehydrogenase [Halorhabdus sp. CBA1104]
MGETGEVVTDPSLPFRPRVAAASLSGASDAAWAKSAAPSVGAAVLGGLAVDEPTRTAARTMVEDRDREEFLPDDPLAFAEQQLAEVTDMSIVPGLNVRSRTLEPLRRVADVCTVHDAICEINAHCRQAEMCDVGAGQSLLREPDRLAAQVATAAEAGATVSVKVRTEVPGVDVPGIARKIEQVGADAIHVDAMDSEGVVAEIVAATDLFVIANNGVRDRGTVREYLAYGADAVSVGRPSDRPVVLDRVRDATDAWFGEPMEGGR